MDEKKKIERLEEISKTQSNRFDCDCIHDAITAIEEVRMAKKMYGKKAFLNAQTYNELQDALKQWLFYNNSSDLRKLAGEE